MNRRNVRQEMVSGAISLLAEKGVQGTSFAVVTEATNTPRGSIYHHFPGGKNELIEEAVASLGSVVTFLIDAVDASSPSQVVDQFLENWRAFLESIQGQKLGPGYAHTAANGYIYHHCTGGGLTPIR